jgi:co-chaperonin GroES (HSP10)
MLKKTAGLGVVVLAAGLTMPAAMFVPCSVAAAQTTPAPAAAGRQMGTVKTVEGHGLTLTTSGGQQVSVSVGDGARLLQLAPGSTDLKTAQAITLNDISAGDRVLVTGKAGEDASTFEASRVILMKSTDIAQKHAMEEADWGKRGAGGIVSAVDAGSGTVTVASGAKKVTVTTSSKTQFRRYAGDSVKFEDAIPGSLAQIKVGDQLRVRGDCSADGSSIEAEEVVSGAFRNLAGTIATINAGDGSITLKDLTTKKTVTVKITANSAVHALPPRAAAMFAARAKGGTNGGPAHAETTHAGAAGGEGQAGEGRAAGMDLSQLVNRLPPETLAELKVGDAVMIVASQPDPGSSTETAVTLLSGVEPILAATPNGSPSMTLSPWNMGAGSADSGAQQ